MYFEVHFLHLAVWKFKMFPALFNYNQTQITVFHTVSFSAVCHFTSLPEQYCNLKLLCCWLFDLHIKLKYNNSTINFNVVPHRTRIILS